jgi:hypothetical protein
MDMTWLTNPGFVFGIYVGIYAGVVGSLRTAWLRMFGMVAGLFAIPLVSFMIRDEGGMLLATYPNRGLFIPGGFVGALLGALAYWLFFVKMKPKFSNTENKDKE